MTKEKEYVYRKWGELRVGTASEVKDEGATEVYKIGERVTISVNVIESPYVSPVKKAKKKVKK